MIGTATRGFDLAAPVILTREDRRRHLHILGKTGVGKSTLLKSLICDDLSAGRNLALLDPLGGLAEAVVDAVPPDRNDEAIYFDPSDVERPVGFNPLHAVPRDQRHLVADHVLSAFLHVWGGTLEDTPRLVYVLYNGLRLLLDVPGSTLLGLPRLLVDDRYRARLLVQCEDEVIANYWQSEFAAYDDRFRAQVISPIQNKVGMLLAPPALRNIVGQPRSTIDIARVMNKGGILIVNLAKGKIGATAAHLLGAFLATTIAQVAEERASIPRDERKDFTLYADELQNFTTDSFSSLLSEARNWNLSLVACHQFLGQLPERVQQAIIANCGSFIVFRVGAYDAKVMAAELDLENPRVLSDAANFTAWAKLLHDGAPTDAFLLETTTAHPPEIGRTRAVIAHTQARHARARDMVEASIKKQMRD